MDDNQNQGGQPTMPGAGMPGSDMPSGTPTPPSPASNDMPGAGMPTPPTPPAGEGTGMPTPPPTPTPPAPGADMPTPPAGGPAMPEENNNGGMPGGNPSQG